MKIKYVSYNKEYKLQQHGNWIDLATLSRYRLAVGEMRVLSLGLAMRLPKHYEAYVLPRSSTFIKHGILMANSQGVIDEEFCGNDDVWSFIALSTKEVNLDRGTRIAQFRIMLSQDAPWWTKLRHLFSKPRLVEVNSLGWPSRGGLGSSGI